VKVLRYIELKSGHSDNGPAWIGYVTSSKTGRTLYFNGQGLMKRKGQRRGESGGNYVDMETGEFTNGSPHMAATPVPSQRAQLLGRPWPNRLKMHRNFIHGASRRRDIFHGNNANSLDAVFPNQSAAFAVVGKKIEICGWNDRAVFLSGEQRIKAAIVANAEA
jgi:hypothetical protein